MHEEEGNRLLISAVVITKNEEANIARCLASLKGVADEVIVVDSGSTDSTCELALAVGARVVTHAFQGHIEQKNWARQEAHGEFVLSLDADEALDEVLRKDLMAWRADGDRQEGADGWIVNRLTNYCGHWVRHSGWYPDRKLRLWRKDAGAWGGVNPHDRFELLQGGQEARLTGDLLHYSYNSRADHLKQIAYFSDIAADALSRSGREAGWALAAGKVVFQWMKTYVLRGGFRDGQTGWTIACLSARATRVKYGKLRRLNLARRRLKAGGRAQVRRVLVARTDGLGDVVCSLPIARWLKSVNPELEVAFLVRKYAAEVALACPDVDTVMEWSPGVQPDFSGFDLAVIAFPEKDVVKTLLHSEIPLTAGTGRRAHTWGRLSHPSFESRKRSGRHEAAHGLALLEPVRLAPGMSSPGRALPSEVPSPRLRAPSLPELAVPWLDTSTPVVVVHPGSHGSANNWSIDRYSAFVEAAVQNNWRVIVTGTASEREGLDRVFGNAAVVDATGQLSVGELLGVLARVDCTVAASTGPLHLAAALASPVVGLYGKEPPVWPERWAPLGERVEWIVAEKLAGGSLDIPVVEVVSAVKSVLRNRPLTSHQANR